jgi:AraC family transcriptional regulator of adaptative response/methylated-DNA-[protein]-cysteine methyltransferase
MGTMAAVADDSGLYLLEFVEPHDFEPALESLRLQTKADIRVARNKSLDSIESELQRYFQGSLTQFKTPVRWFGTPFQQSVWKGLQAIPYGETRSYLELAHTIKNPLAVRAVAQANGANQFAIMIPCHRVINQDGKLGGYGGGLHRKTWLLQHEKGQH